jgi:hypothetical protein
MNKGQIIKILQQAKPDHIEWIKQAHKLLANHPQEQINKPVTCNDCLLGRWHTNEGFKLVNIPQLNQLDDLHKDIHNLYTALYYTTFDRRKTPRATIISKGVEIPLKEKNFRDKKLKLLEKKTVTLVRSLESIEKKVANMSEQDFSSPWLS